jgi:hypothetical protein
VPVELVPAVETRRGDLFDLGVLLCHHLLEHGGEGDAEALDRIK